jgi:hypothetical protein
MGDPPSGKSVFVVDYILAETAYPGISLESNAAFHLFINGAVMALPATPTYGSHWSVALNMHIPVTSSNPISLDVTQTQVVTNGPPATPYKGRGGNFSLVGHYE